MRTSRATCKDPLDYMPEVKPFYGYEDDETTWCQPPPREKEPTVNSFNTDLRKHKKFISSLVKDYVNVYHNPTPELHHGDVYYKIDNYLSQKNVPNKERFKVDESIARALNKHLKTENKDRINLWFVSDVKTVVAYQSKKGYKFHDKVPLGEWYPQELAEHVEGKRISYYPFLSLHHTGMRKKGFSGNYASVQEHPFIICDFDHNSAEEVSKILSETDHCLSKYSYLIIPSLSGKHCHLIIWVDLTYISNEQPWVNEKEQAFENYKLSQRYRSYCSLTRKIIELLAEETGLKADKNCVGKHIAYNPLEFKAINEFFKDKEPSVIRLRTAEEKKKERLVTAILDRRKQKEEAAIFQAKLELEEKARACATHKKHIRKQLTPFFTETDALFTALDTDYDKFSDEIRKFAETYLGAKRVQTSLNFKQDHYADVVAMYKANREAWQDYICENWLRFKILAIKENDLGLGVSLTLEFFNVADRSDIATYLRHIFAYALNLKLVKNYIFKKKTDIFDFMPEDIEGKSFFSASFLKKHWWTSDKNMSVPSAPYLAENMGNGKTWETVLKYTPFLVGHLGVEDAYALLIEALELSDAKDKFRREKDIHRFVQACHRRKIYHDSGGERRRAA